MALPDEVVTSFAKLMNEPVDTPAKETTLYGTARVDGDSNYVRINGSEYYTPVVTSAELKTGDLVTVTVKDHSAIVTNNLTSPSASKDSVDELGTYVSDLTADNVTINGKLEAAEANIEKLSTEKLDASYADITYAEIADLNAINAHIDNLEAEYGSFKDLTTEDLTAINAFIDSADIKYANIDFANIGDAAIENFFAKSGMIGDLVVDNGTVTGTLVGVTIKGDLIEGGTVVADKLVIQGEDGLYYKLNTNGETISAEQTEYNSLSGTIITAKSITAEKISVSDLVAFGATIGGYHITEDSLYSGVKESVLNTTRGVYMDDDGQFALGDNKNYLRFYKDTDGEYKLAISASTISFYTSGSSVESSLNDAIIETIEEFYKSDSPTELVGGAWSTEQPVWEEGKYLWRRTKVTHADSTTTYTPSEMGVCITGNTGSSSDSSKISDIVSGTDTVTIGENAGKKPIETIIYGKTTKDSTGLHSIDSVSINVDGTTVPIDLKGNMLCSLPDGTCDELHIDYSGNTKIVKRTVADTLDDTDSWALSGGKNNKFYLSDLDEYYDFSVENNAYCDDYDTITSSEFNDDITGIRFGKSTFGLTNIWVCDPQYTGVDAFKAALASNPISIVVKPVAESEVTLDPVDFPLLNQNGSTITITAPVSTEISVNYWCTAGKEIIEAWENANSALDAIEDAKTELKTYTDSKIEQTSESIKSEVSESVSETITSSVDGLQQQITSNQTNITELEQTAQGWEFNFNSIQSTVTELGDQVTANYTEQLKYIRFINGEIWIGEVAESGEDEFMVVISNERISFRQNNSEIAYLSNNQLYITNATVTNQLDIGDFSWRPRSNGNTTLVYMG